MSNEGSELLPYILQALSKKPELCETYDNVCKRIDHMLSVNNLKGRYGNTRIAVKNALDVGQNLGILTLTDDLIRGHCKFNISTEGSTSPKNVEQTALCNEVEFVTQPRRIHVAQPTLLTGGRRRRTSRRSRSSRSRSARRSRNARRSHTRTSRRFMHN